LRRELSKKIHVYRTAFSAISELKHRRKCVEAKALARRVKRSFRNVERPKFNRLHQTQKTGRPLADVPTTKDRLVRRACESRLSAMSSNHDIGIRSLSGPEETARDPGCKSEIDMDAASAEESYAGRTYYFCSDECAELFRMSPESYVPRVAQA
jgi:YHS domain-containing protein